MADADETSSADPQALIAYSEAGLRIDAQLEASAVRLAAILDEFAATCTEYHTGVDGSLADGLRDLARRNREHNLWVRRVAEQYLAADSGTVQEPGPGIVRDQTATGQQDELAALLRAAVGLLPPDVGARVIALVAAGDVQDALIQAGLLPARTADPNADSANAPLDGLSTLRDAALGLLEHAKDTVGDTLEALAAGLPAFPTAELDPTGPIARQARGEPINPLDWSQEVGAVEAESLLAGLPPEIRDARVSVSLPGIGEKTLSLTGLVGLALDPANVVGGPIDGKGAALLERALASADGPLRDVLERLLGRSIAGLRRSPLIELSDADIAILKQEFTELGGDPATLVFNQGGQTGYLTDRRIIQVRGDVLPATWETHPRSTMTSRAVLGHELGHAAHPDTDLAFGAWNDEFRASYWAAKTLPNLTHQERADLLRDAISRAQEAGVPTKLNSFMMEVLHGYPVEP